MQGNSDPVQMYVPARDCVPQSGTVLRCLGTSQVEQPASSLLAPVATGEGDLVASGPAPGVGNPRAPLQLCRQQVD